MMAIVHVLSVNNYPMVSMECCNWYNFIVNCPMCNIILASLVMYTCLYIALLTCTYPVYDCTCVCVCVCACACACACVGVSCAPPPQLMSCNVQWYRVFTCTQWVYSWLNNSQKIVASLYSACRFVNSSVTWLDVEVPTCIIHVPSYHQYMCY